MIKVENLSKHFNEVVAVDNISFEILKGEIVGFIGPNGSGKSTTIRAILNLLKPTSGSVYIFDECVECENLENKKLIGYVPSEVNFYNNQTPRDVFDFVCSFLDNVDISYVDYLCDYFDMDVNKKISQLSLGNKKKVSIIASLIKKPEILILDEPTNGLDPIIADKLFKHLLELRKKGVTIFLSSHNLSEVKKYCNRVLIIKEGRIIDTLDMTSSVVSKLHVKYTTYDNVNTSYLYDGDINKLILSLSNLNLIKLEIKEVELEEEFMKYYTDL